MAGVGGYQAPRNPAPASGPGRLARRTDGGPGQKVMTPTGLPYGDAGALEAQQRSAALSQSPSVPTASVGGDGGQPEGGPQITGFGEPTQLPDQPVTAGSPMGAGPGPEALRGGMNPVSSYGPLADMLSQLSASDATGSLAALMMEAQRRGL
jgi:hypothetical protein